MTFTDNDLKRLKDRVAPDTIGERITLEVDFVKALLSRLEAKESVCSAVGDYKKECENPVPDPIYKRTLRNRVFELYEAWRKEAGK